jgi:mono/diheme cytochrome c family protein
MEVRRPAMEEIPSGVWTEQARRGEFLVRIASCETCHTPKRDGQFIPRLDFGGGTTIRGVASTNITFDTSGISYYSFDQFISVMRTGRIGARAIDPAMPWFFYKKMTTEDLAAIFAYLQAIPHVKH